MSPMTDENGPSVLLLPGSLCLQVAFVVPMHRCWCIQPPRVASASSFGLHLCKARQLEAGKEGPNECCEPLRRLLLANLIIKKQCSVGPLILGSDVANRTWRTKNRVPDYRSHRWFFL